MGTKARTQRRYADWNLMNIDIKSAHTAVILGFSILNNLSQSLPSLSDPAKGYMYRNVTNPVGRR